MWRWISAYVAMVVTLIVSWQLSAQTIGEGMWKAGSASAAYVGPGNVAGWSGFTEWFSCARGFTAAYASGGGNACDIVDTATGLASCTMKLKSTGFADLTSAICAGNTVSVTTFCTVTHAAGCSVTKMYDQTGHSNDITQATLANMPILNLSAQNSLPCPVWSASNGMGFATTGVQNIPQPLTISMVTFHVGSSGSAADTPISDGSVLTFFSGTSANTITTFAGGSNESVTGNGVADNAWLALQDVWDDTNSLSAIYANGTNTLYNGIGTAGLGNGGGFDIFIGTSGGSGFPYDGTICEIGVDNTSPSPTQKSQLTSNQRSITTGYNF